MNREYYDSQIYQRKMQDEARQQRLVRQMQAENRINLRYRLGQILVMAGESLKQDNHPAPRVKTRTRPAYR